MNHVRKIAPEDNLSVWLSRGKSDVFTVTTEVTPIMAERLLMGNANNRHLRMKGTTRSVEAYASAMARGEWQLNGETIIIASDGHLNDGQHRLHAVLQSGVSIQAQITFGVERESRHTVDQGAARTPGNILAMYGEKSTNQLAHALQFVWAYDEAPTLNFRPSTEQMLATLDSNPGIREAIKVATTIRTQFSTSIGYIAGAIYVCARMEPDAAEQFADKVKTGLGITSEGSPIFKLRKLFLDHATKKNIQPAMDQAALFIKAFNAYRLGKNIRNLSWRRYGPAAEEFPRAM